MQLGIEWSWAYRFAYSRKGGWRLALSQIMHQAITIERLEMRGYRAFLDYYLTLKYGKKSVQ